MKRPAECFQHVGGPNRNGSCEDRVMAKAAIPSVDELRQLLRCEAEIGKLFWLPRADHQIKPGGHTTEWRAKLWNAKMAGTEAFTSINSSGYRRGIVNGYPAQAHRVIWAMHYGEWPSMHLDHINRDRSDNRISNLRLATPSQNCVNRPLLKKPTHSKYRGVCRARTGKWTASISADRVIRHLGSFDTEIAAALAYDAAAKTLHGEFAMPNFEG